MMAKIQIDMKELQDRGKSMFEAARKTGKEKFDLWYKEGNEFVNHLVKLGEEFVATNPVTNNQTINRARLEMETLVNRVTNDVDAGIKKLNDFSLPYIKPVVDAVPQHVKDMATKLPKPWLFKHVSKAATPDAPAASAEAAPVAAATSKTGESEKKAAAPQSLEEPFEDYSAMNVHKIVTQLHDLTDAQLVKVIAFESAAKNRLTILREVERLQGMRKN